MTTTIGGIAEGANITSGTTHQIIVSTTTASAQSIAAYVRSGSGSITPASSNTLTGAVFTYTAPTIGAGTTIPAQIGAQAFGGVGLTSRPVGDPAYIDFNIVRGGTTATPPKPPDTVETQGIWALTRRRRPGSAEWVSVGTPYMIESPEGAEIFELDLFRVVPNTMDPVDAERPIGSWEFTPPAKWVQSSGSPWNRDRSGGSGFDPSTEKIICSTALIVRATAATQTWTSSIENRDSLWSAPVLCGGESQLRPIYIRAARQPSSPASSTTLAPGDWEEEAPDGTDLLWAATRHRPLGSPRWTTLGRPYQIQGEDGADGQAGQDGQDGVDGRDAAGGITIFKAFPGRNVTPTVTTPDGAAFDSSAAALDPADGWQVGIRPSTVEVDGEEVPFDAFRFVVFRSYGIVTDDGTVPTWNESIVDQPINAANTLYREYPDVKDPPPQPLPEDAYDAFGTLVFGQAASSSGQVGVGGLMYVARHNIPGGVFFEFTGTDDGTVRSLFLRAAQNRGSSQTIVEDGVEILDQHSRSVGNVAETLREGGIWVAGEARSGYNWWQLRGSLYAGSRNSVYGIIVSGSFAGLSGDPASPPTSTPISIQPSDGQLEVTPTENRRYEFMPIARYQYRYRDLNSLALESVASATVTPDGGVVGWNGGIGLGAADYTPRGAEFRIDGVAWSDPIRIATFGSLVNRRFSIAGFFRPSGGTVHIGTFTFPTRWTSRSSGSPGDRQWRFRGKKLGENDVSTLTSWTDLENARERMLEINLTTPAHIINFIGDADKAQVNDWAENYVHVHFANGDQIMLHGLFKQVSGVVASIQFDSLIAHHAGSFPGGSMDFRHGGAVRMTGASGYKSATIPVLHDGGGAYIVAGVEGAPDAGFDELAIWDPDEAEGWSSVETTFDLPIIIDGLDNKEAYEVQVRAFDAINSVHTTPFESAERLAIPAHPRAPDAASVLPASGQGVTRGYWRLPTGATEARLQYRLVEEGTWKTVIQNFLGTRYTIPNLPDGEEVETRLIVANASGMTTGPSQTVVVGHNRTGQMRIPRRPAVIAGQQGLTSGAEGAGWLDNPPIDIAGDKILWTCNQYLSTDTIDGRMFYSFSRPSRHVDRLADVNFVYVGVWSVQPGSYYEAQNLVRVVQTITEGDTIRYVETEYRCLQRHERLPGTDPEDNEALWEVFSAPGGFTFTRPPLPTSRDAETEFENSYSIIHNILLSSPEELPDMQGEWKAGWRQGSSYVNIGRGDVMGAGDTTYELPRDRDWTAVRDWVNVFGFNEVDVTGKNSSGDVGGTGFVEHLKATVEGGTKVRCRIRFGTDHWIEGTILRVQEDDDVAGRDAQIEQGRSIFGYRWVMTWGSIDRLYQQPTTTPLAIPGRNRTTITFSIGPPTTP